MSEECVHCDGSGKIPVGKIPFTKNLYLLAPCSECHGTGLKDMGYERSEWKPESPMPKCEHSDQSLEFTHMSLDRFQMFQCPKRK